MDQGIGQPKTRIEKIVEEALTIVREAARAMEAEAEALLEVEKVYKKANDAATEVKVSIETSKVAKIKARNARIRLNQAIEKAKAAAQVEVWADKDDDKKQIILKDEEDKAAEARENGKQFNQAAVAKARNQAKISEQKAIREQQAAQIAKEALLIAEEEAKLTEKETEIADTSVRTAKEAEASARVEVPRVETIVQRAMKVANLALENEARAKKHMDHIISSLKPLMAKEARIVQVTQTARIRAGLREAETSRRETTIEAKEIATFKPGVSVYSGTVKLFIASPADQSMVQRFQERLTQFDGFRVKSVYGSGREGTNITVVAERPVPLIGQLKELELVERVSRINRKEIEVALKPAHQIF
jgi:hypothetical protein